MDVKTAQQQSFVKKQIHAWAAATAFQYGLAKE